ncbi:RsmB/NOP family class I SAM-dependent RNA methyltransferase [Pararhodobacter sp. SW119]|uniref:RsmB/NOP family class I SAM-dependent RNA methyltransferase n=1 Tax=Pararhodobacter sp. SW119 TaxID=2780075 RepID=UPI001ADFBE26|nr:RsmB/NOP family class I SAM-dependent RNA methyltransferase [Pararhodobacter sp. SW119]
MTPAARQSAAIEILDRILAGEPAEVALTRWARGARYAGSGDREAVRDWAFRALRQRRSSLAWSGAAAETGRALMLGMLRMDGQAPEGWTGSNHSPAPPSAEESAALSASPPALSRAVSGDCPNWLLPHFDASLGARADAVLAAMRERAPVFVRVHAGRANPSAVMVDLEGLGISARPHPLARQALELTGAVRRLRQSDSFASGAIELQDAASQAVVETLGEHLPEGARILDYCAGGGGKALALAALGFEVSAHDIDPRRMQDLPARAARAGDNISLVSSPRGHWSGVLVDAPCSGSGSWRRTPEAKWRLTPDRLIELQQTQDTILAQCADLVTPGGLLAYVTCSLFDDENGVRVANFLDDYSDWAEVARHVWAPIEGGDGFFLSILRKL